MTAYANAIMPEIGMSCGDGWIAVWTHSGESFEVRRGGKIEICGEFLAYDLCAILALSEEMEK